MVKLGFTNLDFQGWSIKVAVERHLMWTFAFVWAPAVMGCLEIFRWIPLDVPRKNHQVGLRLVKVFHVFFGTNGLDVGPCWIWPHWSRGFVGQSNSVSHISKVRSRPTTCRTCMNVRQRTKLALWYMIWANNIEISLNSLDIKDHLEKPIAKMPPNLGEFVEVSPDRSD